MTPGSANWNDDPAPAEAGMRPARAFRFPRGDDFDRDVWCVLGLPIDMADVPAAVAAIETAVRDRRPLNLATPNVNWLARALRDRAARREILNADLSLADGAPLAAMARLLGAPLRGRTAGSDVFEALRARPGFPGRRLRVFFFGGQDGAAEAAARTLANDRGALEPAGFLNPGFGDVEAMSAQKIIDAVNEASPDFVVVALGAAKGQAWIDRNMGRLAAPVVSHLGAVVNFTAGSLARAPRWLRRLGLEWAWRIYQEPSLSGRYASDGLAFARILALQAAPQIFAGRGRAAEGAAKAEVEWSAGQATVRLAGDLRSGGLAPVRTAFRAAAAAEGGVTLDFADGARMDRAFLGLVLMLEKHAARRGAELRVRGLSKAQRALFKANAMNYPTADEGMGAAGGEERAARAVVA